MEKDLLPYGRKVFFYKEKKWASQDLNLPPSD
jgi:hypothetical protein